MNHYTRMELPKWQRAIKKAQRTDKYFAQHRPGMNKPAESA